MGKTIIQTIGPLYGEVVNGTVFGRPNGSVYVPSSNTIALSDVSYICKFTFSFGDRYIACNADGTGSNYTIVAESQDSQSYISTSLEDADGNDIGVERRNSAGLFNITNNIVASYASADPEIVAGATYYLVATLYSANGVPIATTKKAVQGVII